jgi:hypothetical protein
MNKIIFALLAMFSLTWVSGVYADSMGNKSRNFTLEPVAGASLYRNPLVWVNINSFSDQQEWWDETTIKYRGMIPSRMERPLLYAVYITTGENPSDYDVSDPTNNGRLVFNVNLGRDGEVYLGKLPSGITIDSPIITVFVALEFDDGRHFDPINYPGDMDRLLFVGTSYRQ